MTYCEQTGIDEFAIHLNKKQLDSLIASLSGSDEPGLISLLKAIHKEHLSDLNPGFERKRNIKLCHKCNGSGRIRIGNLRSMSYDNEDCPFCSGQGNIIEETRVSYQRITTNLKDEFAY